MEKNAGEKTHGFCAIKMWGFTHQFSNEAKSVQTWACFMGKSLIGIDLGHPYVRKHTFFSSRCWKTWPPFTEIGHFTEETMQESMAEAMFLRMNLEDPDLEAERRWGPDAWWFMVIGKLNIFIHIISGYIMVI